MDNGLAAQEIFFIIAVGIVIMAGLAVALVLFVNRAQRKLHREQLTYQEQLLYRTIRTQEVERQRIAKDLHDEVGSKLSVISLHLHQLRKAAARPEIISNTVQDLLDVVGNTINVTRRISHDLLPPTLENFGLREAIRELCEAYPADGSPRIEFALLQDQSPSVDKTVELGLFRIVQELINNSIKHGAPSQIGIDLWLQPEGIALKYQDDGRGFDPKRHKRGAGLGLQNIESRAKMIQANYQLHSQPGQGMMAQFEYQINA